MRKVVIAKEQIEEAINTSKNVEEVLKKLNVTYGVLYARCREYNLSMAHFRQKIFIDDAQFEKLYEAGYSDAQIGRELNIDSRRIQEYRAHKNLPKRTYREITLTSEQYQVFLGGMYGDS